MLQSLGELKELDAYSSISWTSLSFTLPIENYTCEIYIPVQISRSFFWNLPIDLLQWTFGPLAVYFWYLLESIFQG